MAGFNKVILMGNLVVSPELKQRKDGSFVCNFSIAVNTDRNQQPLFIKCTVFRSNAQYLCQYFKKGQSVLLEGKLINSEYTKADGTKVREIVLFAFTVEACGGGTRQTVPDYYDGNGGISESDEAGAQSETSATGATMPPPITKAPSYSYNYTSEAKFEDIEESSDELPF